MSELDDKAAVLETRILVLRKYLVKLQFELVELGMQIKGDLPTDSKLERLPGHTW